jgi:hypothetical protein
MSNHSILRRLWLLALALLLVGSAPACGKFRRGVNAAPAVLVFSNESLDQAAVFVVVPGLQAARIGTVMAGRTERLTVPPDLVARGGSLNIVARLLARSARPSTGPVSLYPGEEYQVTLPPDARVLVFLPR